MPTFSYQAQSETGQTVRGTLDAETIDHAQRKLLALGYIPVSLAPGNANAGISGKIDEFFINMSGVPTKDVILFTKQLRTMIQAGLSLLEILRILEEQTENKKLKRICAEMNASIKQGKTLFEAFSEHPKVFSGLYRNMIKAGEESGTLPEVLHRLIYLIEHERKVKSDIKSALQYPITVVIVLGLAFYVLLTFVIPKFVEIFAKAHIEMPWPTKVAIGMYEFFAAYGYYLLFGAIVGLFAFMKFLKTERGRLMWDRFWLTVPIFGPLFTKAAMARFAAIFSILQASGVSVLTILDILGGTIGNSAIALEFSQIKAQLKEGRGLAPPFRHTKHFTPMVINMVSVGEESGNLEEMLQAVANHYDDEVSYAVASLSAAINPILILGLAGVVGFFALAIYLPMWDMTKMVK
ncbi:type II secretion system F family protein [Fundidesulfovibrio agrisoli]|uniref:type II secretion system F family protein n=1 Tax=Fundidesulfovibrio agrisoli TaxID=2922717 RepID=UPI001FAC97FC|nr:type II secretion system F family protein [Fundidesulfovibrio agrisoli]